ncbi:MAG: type IX secretion system membrane protein PorP/SprF [Bacteroidia bacterium]|nr:type IX secretion system membrane protein PorP/SprF [Bacteroidia bacterium]MCZ2249657.1 type IX secretion system membrane protein PorP/SprF [Bacteroidia bacterium]
MRLSIKTISITLVLFLFLGVFHVKAQQTSQYTQYILNYFGVNPAAGGSTKCLQSKVGYRKQWWGFEGAPVDQFFSVHGVLKNKTPYNKRKNVLGFYQERDMTGPTTRNSFNLNYSFHVPLSSDFYLSTGVFAGLIQYGFIRDNVTLTRGDDPAIGASKKVIIYPDLNPGIMLYNPNFFLGYSMKYALQRKLNAVYGFNSALDRTHYFTTGASIPGNRKEFSYLPSINVKYAMGAPIGLDVGFLIDYNDVFRWGFIYRKRDAVCALVQFRVKKFQLGYAFDYVTSKVRYGAANSHEIIIGYRFCRKDADGLDEKERCYAYD